MIRGLIRLVIVVVVIVGLGAFFLGYRWADHGVSAPAARPVGTTGKVEGIDTARAREAGAEIGEKVAVGASAASRAVSDASLTAKIRAKMALDDTISVSNINVDSNRSTVTLTGRVDDEAEHARVVQLTRETEGVKSVVDHLSVGP